MTQPAPIITARNWIKKGCAPIPVPYDSKGPAIKGWTALRITDETATDYFNADQLNVGVLMGAPSDWLIDIDLDTPEAVDVAPIFFPNTCSFGRRTRPRSHLLYRSPGTDTKKYVYAGTMLLEVRSTGTQTVVPGSFHSGEHIEFTADTPPAATLDNGSLMAAAGKTAAASLLARIWRDMKGGRHAATLALSGALLHSGCSGEDTLKFIGSIVRAAGDEESKDRLHAIQDSIEKYSRKKQTSGWPTLAEYLDEDVIRKIREWLDIKDDASYGLIIAGKAAARSNPNEWFDPEPLIDSLKPVDPFDFDLLPESLRGWVSDISHRMQCPPDFPAIGAMVALSSVVGRKIAIHPKQQDDWRVMPNLWGVAIGRPSTMKTPALDEVMKPLRHLEAEAKKTYEAALKVHEAEKTLHEFALEKAKAGAKRAMESNCKDEARSILLEMESAVPESPTRQRFIVNDTSVEKLGELLNENPNGLLLFRDELYGFLRSIDREDKANDRAFYLEAFNGTGRYTYDRIKRGTIDIEAATVSLLGGIQPSRLQPYVRSTINGGLGDDGMLQRIQLAVYPDSPANWTYVDQWPDKAAKERAYTVFSRLAGWKPITDDMDTARFASNAQPLFIEWLTELEDTIRKRDLHPALEAHLVKYRSLVPSLALLIHLAEDRDPLQIGRDALLRALGWTQYLQSHAERIYGLFIDAAVVNARILLDKIKNGKLDREFTSRDIQRKGWSGLDGAEAISNATNLLIDHGYLRAETKTSTGRPSMVYQVHPSLAEVSHGE